MPIAYTWRNSRFTVAATALIWAAAGSPAWAGTRAPIVYAADKVSTASPNAAMVNPAGNGVDKATQRIEFRYPGDLTAAAPTPVSRTQPAAGPIAASRPLVTPPNYTPGAFIIPSAPAPSIVEGEALAPIMPVAPKLTGAKVTASSAETATAIIYGDEYVGLPTANGEIFDQNALTAAHPTLPLPTMVTAMNPATGREVTLRVNDRGPFEDGATLQVSAQAARELGFDGAGRAELLVQATGAGQELAQGKRGEPTSVFKAPPAPQPPADELLGGNGTVWSAKPAAARVDVKWPEPPAEWGTTPASMKVGAQVSGALYVQLGSFSDIGNAESLYRRLNSDMPVEIVPARVNGGDYFRVRVGPLADRETAQSVRDFLDAEGKGNGRIVTAE